MKPAFALTMGDPCGIGPEVIVKALTRNPELYKICDPVVIGQKILLESTAESLKIKISVSGYKTGAAARPAAGNIVCLDTGLLPLRPETGKITAEGGRQAFAAVKKAIEETLNKRFSAVVTAPINKESLRKAKVPYLDHTEMFTRMTGSRNTMTLFVTGPLRVFFYSRHIPLKDVAAALNPAALDSAISNSCRYLEQIGIANPRLAVAALNPHGGEQGMFGEEEATLLAPAVDRARTAGLKVSGPVPADSVYHLAKEGTYDGVLSLYHDQGQIATKTLDFHRTVSLTMGLPFLRTSVDHGTAFDIAGKGEASEISMVEAIRAAAKYAW